jgi:hypothetical protein
LGWLFKILTIQVDRNDPERQEKMSKRGLIFAVVVLFIVGMLIGCGSHKEPLTTEQKIKNAQIGELSNYGSASDQFSVQKRHDGMNFVVATVAPTMGHYCGVGLIDKDSEFRVVALWDVDKNGMPVIGQEHIKVTNIGYHTLPTSSHNGWESTNIAEPGSISKK